MSVKETNPLSIELSKSLRAKLESQAEEEGLAISDFVEELLAESVVMRAYEIAERRAAQKMDHSSSPQSQNYNSRSGAQRPQHQNRGHKRHRSAGQKGPSQNYQNVMDDGANFREYVRAQESS